MPWLEDITSWVVGNLPQKDYAQISKTEKIAIRGGWKPDSYSPSMRDKLHRWLSDWYTLEIKQLPEPATKRRRNPDDNFRKHEREFLQDDSPEVKRKLIISRVRAGTLPENYVILAAILGNPLAKQILGLEFFSEMEASLALASMHPLAGSFADQIPQIAACRRRYLDTVQLPPESRDQLILAALRHVIQEAWDGKVIRPEQYKELQQWASDPTKWAHDLVRALPFGRRSFELYRVTFSILNLVRGRTIGGMAVFSELLERLLSCVARFPGGDKDDGKINVKNEFWWQNEIIANHLLWGNNASL